MENKRDLVLETIEEISFVGCPVRWIKIWLSGLIFDHNTKNQADLGIK